MREEGEDTMDNANDNATIFDQVERHLAETEAPFDVEAGLGLLRRRLAEPVESDTPHKGGVVMDYRTQDGLADYGFSIEFRPDVGWRVYIVFEPFQQGHRDSLKPLYQSIDGDGRRYVDWSSKLDNLEDAKTVAKLWAEVAQGYQHAQEKNALYVEQIRRHRRTREQTGATPPGPDRLDPATPGGVNRRQSRAGGSGVSDLAG